MYLPKNVIHVNPSDFQTTIDLFKITKPTRID